MHEGSSPNWGTLTDGSTGLNTNLGQSCTPSDGESVTFTFDTVVNFNGYTITSIDTYAAWQDTGRDNQDFTIQYATVSAPSTFINLATVANHTVGANFATHTSITDTNGVVATNVAVIRFNFAGQENGYVGLREFIVLGAPVSTLTPVTWTGLTGPSWTTTADNNWKKTMDGGAANYANGAPVTFDSTGTNTTNIVVQAAGVTPGSLSFVNDSSKTYSFSGGSITTTASSGSLTLNSATTPGTVTINAPLNLAGPVNVLNGTLELLKPNTLAGATTVGGTLNVGDNQGLGNSALTVNGTVNFLAAAPAITTVTGPAGSKIVLGNTVGPVNTILSVGAVNGNSTFSGVIGQATGTTSGLTKAGTGTLALGGVNTYTGATTINGGTLRLLAGSSLAAGSAVSVGTNTNLTGVGAANGAVSVPASAHLAPGINTTGNFGAIGTLTLGSANLNANSVLDIDLGASNASDLLAVTGALTLPTSGSVVVNLPTSGALTKDGTYKILTFGSLVNAFSGAQFRIGTFKTGGGSYNFVRNGNEIDLVITGASVAGGVFSSAFLGNGDFDASIGLSASKTYLNAVNTGTASGTPAVLVNGVSFERSFVGNPAGTGTGGTTWLVTGPGNVFFPGPGNANNVTGNLGSVLNDFIFGGNPTVLSLTGLTVGQGYIVTFYNRAWDTAGQRVQNLSASDGGTGVFDEDLNAATGGEGNLLRYSFVANGTNESITLTPQVPANTMHLYGFSTEQIFTKIWVSGGTLSTAVFNPPGAPSGPGSNAWFPDTGNAATINVDAPLTIGHLRFDGPGWQINGSPVTLQADVGGVSVLETNSVGGSQVSTAHTFKVPVVLGTTAAKLSGGILIFNGGVSGTGGLIVNQGGVVLNASNTYSGATAINGGSLLLSDAGAFGSAGGGTLSVTVNPGGVLDLNGISPTAAVPTTIGGAGAGAGALINSSNTAATYSGAITISGTMTVGGVGDITLSGAVGGTGPVTLIKTGSATLTLSGAADNANLSIIVNSGIVVFNKTSGAAVHAINGNATISPSSMLTLSGTGGDQISDSSSVDVNANATFDLNGRSEAIDVLGSLGTVTNGAAAASTFTVGANNGNSTFGGVIKNGTGTTGLTKAGTGTLILAATQTYTGATVINAGTVKLGASPPNSPVARYMLDGSGIVPNTAGAILDSGFASANHGTMIGSGATYVPGHFGQGIKFTGSQFITVPDAPNLHATGMFTASAWLNVAAAPPNGTIWGIVGTRSDANEFTFDMKYQTIGGVTGLHADIGSGTNWLTTNADFVTTLSNNVWHMVTYVVTSTGYTIYLDGAQVATGAFAGTPVFMKAGQSLYIGSDDFSGGQQIELLNGSLDEVFIYSNALSAAEITVLYNTTAPGKIPSGSALSLATGGTFDLFGNDQPVSSLSNTAAGQTGTVTNTLRAAILSVQGGSTSFSGVLTDPGAATPLSLTLTGVTSLKLTATNTYSGTTEVQSAGKLIVDGSLSAGGGTVSVLGGQLRGTGNGATGLVDRTVNLTGGFIIPGDTTGTTSAKGTLTINSYTPSANGTVDIRLSNPAMPEADMLKVTAGTPLDLTPAILRIQAQAGNYAAQTLTIFQTTAGDFITGKFGTVSAGTSGITVRYVNAANNVIALPSGVTPANRVQIVLNGAVTPVTLDRFTAQADGAGVLVSWNCISEFHNAGFNVYRRSINGDEWTKVNRALIAGRITNPDAKPYALYDWVSGGGYEYKLESVSIAGSVEAFSLLGGPVTVDAITQATNSGFVAAATSLVKANEAIRSQALSAKFASLDGSSESKSIATNARDARLTWKKSGELVLPATVRALDGAAPLGNNEVAARSATPAAATASAAASARWFSSAASRTNNFTAAKVVYSAAGVLRIPQEALPTGFNTNRVSITREGRALMPLAATSNELLVYAPGYQDDYTDKDALFLRRSNAANTAGQAPRAHGLFASSQPVNVESPASVTASYHDVYFDFDYRPYTMAPWFSSQYLTGGSAQTFTVNVPNASSGAASLMVNLWSLTQSAASPDHALQVLVNGTPAGQAVWSGGEKMMQLNFQLASGVLRNGDNRIDLVTPQLDGVDTQIAFLHSLTISYTQTLNGSKPLDVYNFGGAPKLFELSGLPNADAWVVDARFADRAALVPYESQARADGTWLLRFSAPSGGSGHFVVVPAGQENLPVSASKRTVKAVKPAAYLAVGPNQFSTGVQPLLAARSKEGLRGAFADQEQIFDYYNFGRFGPAGIQNAVRAAQPKYLLLLGRTTYDYRNYSGLGVDPLCPTFLVSTSFWAQATSDSMFGDLGRGYPEVAVGRLPVNTATELHNAVNHVLGNGGLATGYRVHAVADRADPAAGDFASEADALAQAHPDIAWQPNYLGVTYQSSPEVTAAMTDAANGGADVLLYIGHGNAARLGAQDPRILDNQKVAAWTGNKVFVQATCTANWMAKNEDGYQSIAMQAMTQPQGGISASIASSTYMNSQAAMEFVSRLLTNTGTTQRWGDALLKAQQWAHSRGGGFYSDLRATEQIFGDPAMAIRSRSVKGTTTPPNVSTGAF